MRLLALSLCYCAALMGASGCDSQTTIDGGTTSSSGVTSSSTTSGGGQAAGGTGGSGTAGAGGLGTGGSGTGGLGTGGQLSGGGGAGGMGPSSGVLWARTYGDNIDNFLLGAGHNGTDIAITGYFHNTIDFGGGPLQGAAGREGFRALIDTAGNHLSSQAIVASTPSGHVVGTTVAPDGQGGFYLGGVYSTSTNLGGGPLPATTDGDDFDAMLSRFDASGNHLWSLSYPVGDPNAINSLLSFEIHTVGGDAIVIISAPGTVDLGLGPMAPTGDNDLFVARVDPQGQTLWQRQLGGSGSVLPRVARDLGGRIVLGGWFSLDLEVSDQLTLSSAGSWDGMLLELAPANGDTLWAHSFGDIANDSITAISGAPNGDIVVAGRFYGTVDLGGATLNSPNMTSSFVARYGPTGQHLSSTMSGQLVTFNSVAFDATGRFLLCGQQSDRLRLLAFDAASQLILDYPFPPHTAPPSSHRLLCTSHPSGDFILYGQFEETLDLGLPTTFTSMGGEDSFLAWFTL